MKMDFKLGEPLLWVMEHNYPAVLCIQCEQSKIPDIQKALNAHYFQYVARKIEAESYGEDKAWDVPAWRDDVPAGMPGSIYLELERRNSINMDDVDEEDEDEEDEDEDDDIELGYFYLDEIELEKYKKADNGWYIPDSFSDFSGKTTEYGLQIRLKDLDFCGEGGMTCINIDAWHDTIKTVAQTFHVKWAAYTGHTGSDSKCGWANEGFYGDDEVAPCLPVRAL